MKVYQYLNEIRLIENVSLPELSNRCKTGTRTLYKFLNDDQGRKLSTTAFKIADALVLPTEDKPSCMARIARYYHDRCERLSDPQLELFRILILPLSDKKRDFLYQIAQLLSLE